MNGGPSKYISNAYSMLDGYAFFLNCGVFLLSVKELTTKICYWIIQTFSICLAQNCTNAIVTGICLKDECFIKIWAAKNQCRFQHVSLRH